MKNRIMNIILGFILILAGVLYIFRDSWGINFTSVIFFLIGISLLFSYIKKKNRWSVIPAVYLIFFSTVDIFLRNTEFYAPCVSAVFYMSPGVLFIIWYLKNRKSGYLTLGCIFSAIGVDIILYHMINSNGMSLMIFCIGIALLLSYILHGVYIYKGKLYISLVIILFAVANLLEIKNYVAYAIPSILIVIGFAIIIITIKEGER